MFSESLTLRQERKPVTDVRIANRAGGRARDAGVQVEVEPVPDRLALGYALEEQPAPEAGSAVLPVRVVRMADGGEIAPGGAAVRAAGSFCTGETVRISS